MAKTDVKNISLAEIDKALTVESEIEKEDIFWFDIRKGNFDIYGLYNPTQLGEFKRMPIEVAEKVNIGVHNRAYNTAGGRVRFTTDSPYLAIKVEYSRLDTSPTFALSGMAGIDLYTYKDGCFNFFHEIAPDFTDAEGFERLVELGENTIGYGRSPAETHEKTEYVLTLPTYCSLTNVYIGVKQGSILDHGSEYKLKKPIVYYGSSTTQGGCATKPSLTYEEIISRRFNTDYINLGFSGSAHGEPEMLEYIAKLDMSVFVYDFDYNTDASGLRAKHYNGYKIIREKQPTLPIVIMGHSNFRNEKWNFDRMAALDDTYKRAKEEGDENIYYIRTPDIFGELDTGLCTVDGIHPNDLGFYKISQKLGEVLEKIL